MKKKTTEQNKKSENKFQITPDTTTYAWKQKLYRQDNANKNVCIYQG